MLAGADNLRAIFRWGRRLKPEALRLLGVEDGKAPCHATRHYVFKSLDGDALAATLGRFALRDGDPDVVAVDGKTSRRIHDRGEERGPLHLVSA